MDVRTLTLGVLTHGAMTGYDIKKCVEENFRDVVSASYGSIYPALADLAAAGHVTVTSVEQEKRPDKKVYAITPAGHERLVSDLVATEPRHRVRSEFLVLMCFAHLLPTATVDAAIDSISAYWRRILEEDIEACEAEGLGPNGTPLTPGMRFALGYGRTVVTAAQAYIVRHRGTLLRELAEAANATNPMPSHDQAAHDRAAE